LLRGPPPDLNPLCSWSWPRRSTQVVPRGFSSDPRLHLWSLPPARSVLPLPPARKPRTLAHAVTGLWGEMNCWPPERSGAARSTSAQPTAVSPPSFRYPCKPLTLVEPPKNSLRAGNHQAAGVGSRLLIHAASSPSGSSVAAVPRRFNCQGLQLPNYLPLSMYSLRRPSPSPRSPRTPFDAYSPVEIRLMREDDPFIHEKHREAHQCSTSNMQLNPESKISA
jgi:hypothetical protein